MSVKFTESCAPIGYPCPVGQKYIDPCTCRGYLECKVGGYDFLKRGCGQGTAWNHLTGFCDEESKIFIADGTPICERDEPWERCSEVSNHYSENRLEKFCVTDGGTTPPTSTTTSDPSGGNSGGSNGGNDDDGGSTSSSAGPIAGGVVGGLAVLILVLVVVWWWKRRRRDGKMGKSHLGFRPSTQSQHKEMEEEEVYDVIDEKSVQISPVHNPAYGDQKGRERVESQYDNPAFSLKSENPNGDYCNLKHVEPVTRFTSPNSNSNNNNSNNNNNKSSLDVSPNNKKGASVSSRDTISREDDLSRSISIGGAELLVEDSHGYHVGYPSGSIPRQPSPIPPDALDSGEDVDDGYDLGKAPSMSTRDYYELEKTEL